nr:hypothetical protein [Tanacetum cinerariifolium]
MMIYLRNMARFKMDYYKGMSYDDIHPIFEKYFKTNVAFLEKTKEQIKEEDSRALKRKTKSLEEKVVKKQKLDKEVEKLKKHLQIVPNDDDDVYTEATPLALKRRLGARWSSSNMEESNKCSWFRKGQKLEIVRVLWSTYNNIYNYTDDLAGREKIPIDKTYYCQRKLMLLDNAADIKLRLLEQSAAVVQISVVQIVKTVSIRVNTVMYKLRLLAKKLKFMKKHIRDLKRKNGDVFDKVKFLKTELGRVQGSLDKDPSNTSLKEEEMIYAYAFKEAVLDEEKLLQQKTKIAWLKDGDFNS